MLSGNSIIHGEIILRTKACWPRLFVEIKDTNVIQYASDSNRLIASVYIQNLFNSEVPGVILNANTCITTAIAKMLLQSQAGIINLLPHSAPIQTRFCERSLYKRRFCG